MHRIAAIVHVEAIRTDMEPQKKKNGRRDRLRGSATTSRPGDIYTKATKATGVSGSGYTRYTRPLRRLASTRNRIQAMTMLGRQQMVGITMKSPTAPYATAVAAVLAEPDGRVAFETKRA